jgi:hypothetical protein
MRANTSASPPNEGADVQNQTRVKRGCALRADVINELKLIAVREDRTVYQVMEEAIEQYLVRRAAPRPPQAHSAPVRSE